MNVSKRVTCVERDYLTQLVNIGSSVYSKISNPCSNIVEIQTFIFL